MPAFGSKTLNDLFNTAITPAGEYTLSQDVTGDNINLHKEIPVLIEVTKTISGSLQLLPLKIPSGIEIKWSIKVPGGATQILSYWLKGPDQVGTYEKDATKLPEDATKLLEGATRSPEDGPNFCNIGTYCQSDNKLELSGVHWFIAAGITKLLFIGISKYC